MIIKFLISRLEISSGNRFRRVLAILGIPGIVLLKLDGFGFCNDSPRGKSLFDEGLG